MGHYASEMNGAPYDWFANLDKNIGKPILEAIKLNYTKIESVKINWIIPYSYGHKCYIECTYSDGNMRYTSGGRCIDEFKGVLNKSQIKNIKDALQKEKYITESNIEEIIKRLK